MIEIKSGGKYVNAKKLSGDDMTQFTRLKRIKNGQVKLFLNGNIVQPPNKWIYQFTLPEIDQRLHDWMISKGVTEIRTGE